jgi:hypothetical protein
VPQLVVDRAGDQSRVEPTPIEWDITIERAQQGGLVEDKLIWTAQLLEAAVQRSRLRGDRDALAALTYRLNRVHQLLDQL